MRFSEIKNTLNHLTKTTTCLHCRGPYKIDNINIIATTKTEGLFELHCEKCHVSSIMTVVLTAETEFRPNKISSNDILDLKNFLNRFDGDFEKLFPNEK
ncbi:hypothetical protein HZA40_00690 [Candidatus Peregrinibacteria bacterium]|nr:hypothetical protein [Candidatus Peregrinibacteria bacterium]